MRLAGQVFDLNESQRIYAENQRMPGIGLDPNSLQMTPEMTPSPGGFSSPYEEEYLRDKYIRNNPGSGVARLPGGEQGPAQGYHTPIKNYGGRYMPEGGQPGGLPPSPMGIPLV